MIRITIYGNYLAKEGIVDKFTDEHFNTRIKLFGILLFNKDVTYTYNRNKEEDYTKLVKVFGIKVFKRLWSGQYSKHGNDTSIGFNKNKSC